MIPGATSMRISAAVACAALAQTACGGPSTFVGEHESSIGWSHYAGDAGATRYSRSNRLDRSNVDQLRVVWSVRAGDFPDGSGKSSGSSVTESSETRCQSCRDNNVRFETTPLLFEGNLYVSTPKSRVLALDPETGAVIWDFDPRIDLTRHYSEGLTSRGVATWSDPNARSGRCARRILYATVDARLIALDAADG